MVIIWNFLHHQRKYCQPDYNYIKPLFFKISEHCQAGLHSSESYSGKWWCQDLHCWCWWPGAYCCCHDYSCQTANGSRAGLCSTGIHCIKEPCELHSHRWCWRSRSHRESNANSCWLIWSSGIEKWLTYLYPRYWEIRSIFFSCSVKVYHQKLC